ncbi:MAG: YlxR family protein [Deltaproteobacteria bacterium]|nr:YlxR family protein [Deltaproteobacteria bacterium]
MPIRTCCGCRERCEQATLVRVVCTRAGDLVVDQRRRRPGRGAWVHARKDCIEAGGRGGFSRSFRRQVVMSASAKEELRVAGLSSMVSSVESEA